MRFWLFLFLPFLLFANYQTLLEEGAVKNALVGIYVWDVDQQKVVIDYAGEKLFTPGSVLKLLVARSALETLGKNYRFETEMYSSGKVLQGTLKGALIIFGGGDALLNEEQLDRLVLEIKKRGIKKIEGPICYDSSFFSGLAINPSWQIEDLGTKNAVEPSALSFKKNQVWIRAKEQGGKIHIQVENQLPLKVRNLAKVGNKNTLYIYRSPMSNVITVTGLLPKNQTATRVITLTNPAEICAVVLKKKLQQAGIIVTGGIQRKNKDQHCQKLGVVQSTFLGEHIKMMLKVSDNLIPEQLVRVIGKKEKGVGSYASGLQVVRQHLQNQGIKSDQYQIVDASGLSRKNMITPKIIVDVIRNAMLSDYARDFLSYLAIGGVDGTLTRICKGALQGQIFAKTGTENGFRNLAGLLVTKQGKTLCFCIMINHFVHPAHQICGWTDRLLLDLYLHH